MRWTRLALTLTAGLALGACDKGSDATSADGEAVAKADAAPSDADAANADAAKAEAPAEAAPAAAPGAEAAAAPTESPMIDHVVTDIDGNEVKLADYRGKALLIVNTASECGFTPQYTNLQKLHEAYADKGLVVLGFPSNDFGAQEPGSAEEIKKFTTEQFGVTFPLFSKVKTKGDGQAELYKTLTADTPEHLRGDVKWNFTKFLVSPEGRVVARFESPVDPMSDELREAVEAVLPEPSAG